jgi:hypothetical protein
MKKSGASQGQSFAVSRSGAALSLVAIRLSLSQSVAATVQSLALPSPFGARDQDRRASPLRFYHCSRELRLKPAEAVPLWVGAEGFPMKGFLKCASHAREFTATACY